MTILDAERNFREGLIALAEARHDDASACFERAMRSERARRVRDPKMRYLSYYGLSVVLGQGPIREAIRACEVAARRDFFNPDLLLNLGKVYMIAGRSSQALAAFERGLDIDSKHAGLCAVMLRTDRRRVKPLPWFDRDHPVNYWLGKIRSSRGRSRGPVIAGP